MKRNILLAVAVAGLAAICGGAYYSVQRDDSAPEHFAEDQLNEGGVDDIAELTLPEAKKRINYMIQASGNTLASLARLESLQLRISPSVDTSTPKALQYEAPFVPLTSDGVKAELALLKQQPSQFAQLYFIAGAQLRLNTEAFSALWKRATPPDAEPLEKYAIQTVYFRDGTEQPFAAVREQNEDIQDVKPDSPKPALNLNKPVERIKLTISYNSYPGFKKFVLDQDHPRLKDDQGATYQLAGLEDSTATLLLSLPKAANYVVQGLTQDGKPLRSTGQSSNTLPSPRQRAALKQFYEQLLQTRQHFSQFSSSADVQKQVQASIANLQVDDGQPQSIQAHYFFEDTPHSVVVYLLDPVQEQQVAWEMTNQQPALERYIGYDPEGEMAGFLDSKGQWVVKPKYEDIGYTEVPDIYRVVGKKTAKDGGSQLITKYMSFVPGANELKTLPFDIAREKISDDLLMVERETNGPYGLYDVKKRQIVVPMKFASAKVAGEFFIGNIGEKTYGGNTLTGLYSLSGKELLAPRYSGIDVKGGLIYATSADREHTDVLDSSLKKLNSPGSKVLGGYVAGQPLLIENQNNGQFYFIDAKGKPLPWKLPYDEVKPFSNGMAVVTKDNKSGAIDTTGTLRVPLKFGTLNPFQTNLASAEMDGVDGLVLINKTGAVVKKLGSPTEYTMPTNGNDATYSISTGEDTITVYDADGRQIDQVKRE